MTKPVPYRLHNLPGSRLLDSDPQRAAAERELMEKAPYLLDRDSRAIVLNALREVCLHRGWSLFAAHVRTNHVHVIVEADVRPEKAMNAFKSYASRALNRCDLINQTENAGRAMAARDGYGRTRTCTRPCGM